MFNTSTLAYWCCQAAGWGLAWGIYKMNGEISHWHSNIAPYTCIAGFLATHVLRTCMHRFAPRALTLPKEGLYLLLAIILTTGLATALKCVGLYYFDDLYYRAILFDRDVYCKARHCRGSTWFYSG